MRAAQCRRHAPLRRHPAALRLCPMRRAFAPTPVTPCLSAMPCFADADAADAIFSARLLITPPSARHSRAPPAAMFARFFVCRPPPPAHVDARHMPPILPAPPRFRLFRRCASIFSRRPRPMRPAPFFHGCLLGTVANALRHARRRLNMPARRLCERTRQYARRVLYVLRQPLKRIHTAPPCRPREMI